MVGAASGALSTVQSAIDLVNKALKDGDLEPISPPSIVDEETHFELAIHGMGPPKATISGGFEMKPLQLHLRYWDLSLLHVVVDVGYFGRGKEDINVTWGLVHKYFDGKSNHPHAGDDASGMLYSDNLFLTAVDASTAAAGVDPNDKSPKPVVLEHPGNPHFDKFTARLKLDVGSGVKYATIRSWHFYLNAIHLIEVPEGVITPDPKVPVAPKTPEKTPKDGTPQKSAGKKYM